jgi:hypothetical protein
LLYILTAHLNKSVLAQGEVGTSKHISAIQVAQEGNENGTTPNGQIKNVQFSIDKSQFKKAPELAKISGYINTAPIKLSDLKGGYAETEKVIQSLLQERAVQLGIKDATLLNFLNNSITTTTKPKDVQFVDFSQIKTPELYFGYHLARASLGNPEGHRPNQTVTYSFPSSFSDINLISFILLMENGRITLIIWNCSDTGRITLTYSAKSVNIIA